MHVHNDNGDWWFDVHNVNVMFTMMFTMMVLVIGGMVKLYCDFSSTHDLTDLKAKEKFDELENLNDSFQRKCWCQKKD